MRLPSPAQQLLREHFASLGMTVIEHALAWWASDALVHRLVDLRGAENLERAMAGGRGVILLTGHFGAQEFSGRAFGLSCPTTAGFYRPSRNPLVDELFKRVRKRSAPILIPKDALRRVVRALRRGMPVWYAPDQSHRRAQSALIPFFGEPAMTSTGLSELVRLGNAVVVPLFPTRLPDGRGYRLDILPALEDFPGASPEDGCPARQRDPRGAHPQGAGAVLLAAPPVQGTSGGLSRIRIRVEPGIRRYRG